MDQSKQARTRLRRAMTAVAALGAAVAFLVPSASSSATTAAQQLGAFTFNGKLLAGCPIGAVVCTSGTFTGTVSGTLQFTILTLTPSATQGVEYFDGKLTATTSKGNFTCDLNGALDTGNQGEFGEICVLTGGTGSYAGATGNLRMIGTSTSVLGVPSGAGDYRGTIIS